MSPTSSVQSSVYFHPSVWGDHFITSSLHDLKQDLRNEEKIRQLKKEVNNMLNVTLRDTVKQMNLVDNIQRLGLTYHFESEIESALQTLYETNDPNHDLHATSLRFRLLRQAGFFVSPDVFNNFKNENGELQTHLSMDVQGLLSLYEAAHLGYKEEDLLDEFVAFTTRRLKLMLSHHLISSPLARKVQHALELPLQKRFQRLEARHYISMYQEDESRIQPLLDLAKLDFNMVQLLHQRELNDVCRWWKDVDLMRKLPYATRDRAVEIYALLVGTIDEPRYSLGRIYTTKIFLILFILDDFFDVYKKMDQLQLLTDAILRWDVGTLHELPEYMKEIIVELAKLVNEYGEELAKRGQPYCLSYLKHQIQEYIRYQMEEAKIFCSGQVPKLSDWLEIALVSGSIPFLVMGALLDTKEHASKYALDWATNKPDLITVVAMICGLLGDSKSYEFEQERGNMASNVTCYMKEYGVSEPKAIEIIGQKIKDLWKDVNKECLRPTDVSKPFQVIPINLARVIQVLYIYDNAFTDSRGQAKEVISSMLVQRVLI